jgi:hypothetical protein
MSFLRLNGAIPVTLVFFEILVILSEWRLLKSVVKSGKRSAFLLSVLINTTSYFIGLLIFKIII